MLPPADGPYSSNRQPGHTVLPATGLAGESACPTSAVFTDSLCNAYAFLTQCLWVFDGAQGIIRSMESGDFSGAPLLLVALIVLVISILFCLPRGISRRTGTLLLVLGGTVLFSLGALLHP
jgi:hypothetical protein